MTYIAKLPQVSASNRGPSRSLRQYGCFDIFGISFNCNDRGRRDEDDWRRRERGAPHKRHRGCLTAGICMCRAAIICKW